MRTVIVRLYCLYNYDHWHDCYDIIDKDSFTVLSHYISLYTHPYIYIHTHTRHHHYTYIDLNVVPIDPDRTRCISRLHVSLKATNPIPLLHTLARFLINTRILCIYDVLITYVVCRIQRTPVCAVYCLTQVRRNTTLFK